MKANRGRLYHAGLKQPIRRSTFCDALEKRRHEVFRAASHGLVNGKVHEARQMPNLCRESGLIYAMDRGFLDYKSLYAIELQGSVLVTRAKSNTAYIRTHNKCHPKDGSILSDVAIELTGPAMKKYYPKPMRKVKYRLR